MKAEQQENEEVVLDEYEQSAALFNHLSKQLKGQILKLQNRKKLGPGRVLESLVLSPLEDVELFGEEEKKLLDFCRGLMYHKNKVVEYAITSKQENEKSEVTENE